MAYDLGYFEFNGIAFAGSMSTGLLTIGLPRIATDLTLSQNLLLWLVSPKKKLGSPLPPPPPPPFFFCSEQGKKERKKKEEKKGGVANVMKTHNFLGPLRYTRKTLFLPHATSTPLHQLPANSIH